MRIAFDATPAAVQQAGVGRYGRELLAALVAMPDRDEYVLASAATNTENQRLLGALPPGNLRALHRLPLSPRAMTIGWQRLRIPLPVESLIGPFDVFHGTDFVLPPSRRATVVTVHDLSFLVAPQFAEPSLVSYLTAAVPRTLRSATRIVAVSAAVAAELADLYPAIRSKLVAIPSGVRIPVERSARSSYGRPIILVVGTIEPRKNLSRLIRAMNAVREHHRDAQLVVAGRVGWRSNEIVRELRAAQASGSVQLWLAPDDTRLEALFSEATVVAYPSRYEGFGLPVLEAMARGVPVVTSDIPALRETGGDAAVYFDPDDENEIAASVVRLLDSARLRNEYAERGIERASCFSWYESARRTRRVYQEAVEEHAR